MFFLPITPSPGEHGAEDHTGGVLAQARRSVRQNLHMGVNGFIACALLIQGLSAAGLIPAQVWLAEPGYALTVCLGLVTISASILFSLKSLLTQSSQEVARRDEGVPNASQAPAPQGTSDIRSPEPDSAPIALVLETSRTTQTIVDKSLAKAGIIAVCVNSEVEAKKALQTGHFDLLILGAAWGGHARSSALQEVCEGFSGKRIPVLVLAIDQIADAATSSVDAIVTIPIVPNKLARSAKELIGRTGVGTAAPSPAPRAIPTRELPKLLPEPLDARALGDLDKLGGRDFVRDIVAQFVADAALVLASLAAAVAERDQKAFREQAHALRSCAANVGAQNVYRMCLAWRDLDAQEIAASGVQCMKMLEEEFERVRNALTPMLQDDAGSGSSSEAA